MRGGLAALDEPESVADLAVGELGASAAEVFACCAAFADDRPMVTATGPDDGYVADYPQATGTFFPAIPQRPSSTNDHGAGNDGPALAAANAIMHAVSEAPTAALGHANQARNALGQFVAGAGGESAATANGRRAHDVYKGLLGDTYDYNTAIPETRLRPDAIDWTNRIVRELKPDSIKAIQAGTRQVENYRRILEERPAKPGRHSWMCTANDA